MTEIVAQRKFELSRDDGSATVIVSFGQPAPIPDNTNGDWYCPWRIEGPNGTRELFAGGVDSLQALLLAISMVRSELKFIIAPNGGLTWLSGSDLGLTLAEYNDNE